MRPAGGARGHERFAAVEGQRDPAGGDAQQARAVLVDVERVRAPEIGCRRRSSADDELARRRGDDRVERPALQGQLMMSLTRRHEAHARIGIDRDLADRADVDARLRRAVGDERLADGNASAAGQRRRPDARLAGHAGDFPRRRRAHRAPGTGDHQYDGSRGGEQQSVPPAARALRVRFGEVWKWRHGPQPAQQLLETLNVGIGRPRSVPQVIVVHGCAGSTPSCSRSIFIPRCRFTRTDPGVRPVRAAISSPVMPSTRRISRVSR